jgi:nucleotide-binding universal stress UspA family protein
VDDSDSARFAVRAVRDIFCDRSAEILAVNVARRPIQAIAPGVGYGMVFPGFPLVTEDGELTVDAQLRQKARANAADTLAQAGVDDAAAVGAVGDPVTAILAAAEANDVDLIVAGTEGPGFLDRLFDRSVALALISESTRPVLVVPAHEQPPSTPTEEYPVAKSDRRRVTCPPGPSATSLPPISGAVDDPDQPDDREAGDT